MLTNKIRRMNFLTALATNTLVVLASKEKAFERLLLANSFGLHALREAALNVIRNEFITMYETLGFRNLLFRIVDDILSDLDICEPIMGWFQHPSPNN